MKIIELKDEQHWFINLDDENEKIQYVFTDEVYLKLERIAIITANPVDYPLIVGPKLNAPNLKDLDFMGEGSEMCFKGLNENGICAPILESIWLHNIGITKIPDFVLKFKSLKRLSIQNEKLTELPDELFNLINLQYLSVDYTRNHIIRKIPDGIKNLINLEKFVLESNQIEYLSPELFLLPKIQNINFAYSSYQPTNEVLDALKIFQKKESNYFTKWSNY